MSSNKPRIVILQNQLNELGGISTFCRLISGGLAARGYQVEVGAIHQSMGEKVQPYGPEVTSWVLAEHPAPLPESASVADNQAYRKAVSEFQSQVLQSGKARFSDFDDNTIVIFTQLFSRERLREIIDPAVGAGSFRTVGQFHSSFRAADSWGDLQRIIAGYHDDDLFTCLTEEDAVLFQKKGLNNVSYLHNPAVLSNDEPVSSLENHKVVAISRFDDNKQIDHMLIAWLRISRLAPGWKLELYGSGPKQDELERLIAELGLQDSVKICGVTRDTTGVLREASISLLTSRDEGFPLSLVEASHMGVPSVAYSCSPGVRGILANGEAGILVRQNDTTLLAQAILKLINDTGYRRQVGTAARAHVTKEFALERIMDDWEQMFRDVLR